MDYTFFVCVVMEFAVILALDFFSRTVSGGGNCRPPFATADDFDTAMINRYKRFLLSWQGQNEHGEKG
jgi:hypothetical protein